MSTLFSTDRTADLDSPPIMTSEIFLPMIQMTKEKQQTQITFGQRLAQLRKVAGFSQRDLAKEIGISYRMVAYYEAQTDRPPAHLLPLLAKTLGVSVDELLGLKKSERSHINRKLLKNLEKITLLPRRQQKALLEQIEALSEKYKKAT